MCDVTLEPHITPAHFLKFYETVKNNWRELTPEQTARKDLGLAEGKYQLTAETFKFPVVSERLMVLCVYIIPNY